MNIIISTSQFSTIIGDSEASVTPNGPVPIDAGVEAQKLYVH